MLPNRATHIPATGEIPVPLPCHPDPQTCTSFDVTREAGSPGPPSPPLSDRDPLKNDRFGRPLISDYWGIPGPTFPDLKLPNGSGGLYAPARVFPAPAFPVCPGLGPCPAQAPVALSPGPTVQALQARVSLARQCGFDCGECHCSISNMACSTWHV